MQFRNCGNSMPKQMSNQREDKKRACCKHALRRKGNDDLWNLIPAIVQATQTPGEINPRPPRPTVIIEFIEGDLSKPVIYPNGGSYEADAAIRAEIERRWSGQ